MLKTDRSFHLLTFLLFIFIYFNYLVYGGFGSGDGIGDYNFVKNSNYGILENFKIRIFELNDYSRPVSIFFNILIHTLFKDNLIFYTFFNLFIWYLLIYIIYFCLNFFLYKHVAGYFLLLGLFPFYSTAIFAEPYLLSAYHASILLWAISLYLSLKFSQSYNLYFKIFSILFLILSLLTLEIILPLIILSILLPYILRNSIEQKTSLFVIKNFLIFFIPVSFICFLFLIYKIFIIKLFFSGEIYGYNNIDLVSALQGLYYFFSIIIELPILLYKGILHINFNKLFVIIIFIYLINNYFFNETQKNLVFKKNINYFNVKLFCFSILISIVINSSIFILSSYPSVSYGPYNKMMVCSFIVLSVLISILVLYKKTFFTKILSFVLIFLFINSIEIQFSNFVNSWTLRNYIANKIKNELVDLKNINEVILFANVPHHLNSNYNNEPVFFTKWNLESHLELLNVKNLKDIHLVSYRHLNDKSYNPSHNIMFELDKLKKDDRYYYFEIEEDDDNYIFFNFKNKIKLMSFLKKKKSENINNHPIILREKLRLRLKEVVKNKLKN